MDLTDRNWKSPLYVYIYVDGPLQQNQNWKSHRHIPNFILIFTSNSPSFYMVSLQIGWRPWLLIRRHGVPVWCWSTTFWKWIQEKAWREAEMPSSTTCDYCSGSLSGPLVPQDLPILFQDCLGLKLSLPFMGHHKQASVCLCMCACEHMCVCMLLSACLNNHHRHCR